MHRQQLISQLQQNHQQFIAYINSLSDAQFMQTTNGKWTPGQQLEHILTSVKTLAQIVSNKTFIETRFGKIDREVWSYDETVSNYQTGLANGGKAPAKFLPPAIELNQKQELADSILHFENQLLQSLGSYTDEELNTLVLPHPFLGKLTINEMLYVITYHVLHHLEKTKENLIL